MTFIDEVITSEMGGEPLVKFAQMRGRGLKTGLEPIRIKQRVRMATYAAIRDGLLVPGTCRVCGSDDVEAHHPHYDREDSHLVVDWLCKLDHAREHGVAAWTKQIEMFVMDVDA